jgi:enediyne biosynthesis protein E4
MAPLTRRILAATLMVVICAAFGVLVVRPGLSEAEARRLAQPYQFLVERLNTTPPGGKTERQVAPALAHIRSWISAVGAAVALADLRGYGYASDLCLVDPRDDSVTLRPVPASPQPYAPVQLSTSGVRYDATMAPMGCVPADLDEDGDLDLAVYYWGRSPILFVNTGSARAVPTADAFRATELIEPMEIWNSTALNVGDLDGDGHLDVLVGNYFPDGARVLDPTAADETRMQMQNSMGLARNAGTNRILLATPVRADEVPRLVDASNALPVDAANSWTLAMGMQDLTGDGLPEIYQANDFGPDQLLVNRSTPGKVQLTQVKGSRNLTTPKSQVLGNDSFKGMGVSFTYSPGDDLPTIVVSNITTPYALHESNFVFVPDGAGSELLAGRLPFRERSEHLGLARAGWCWDVKSGDFDNDGVDEIVQANGFLKGGVNRWPVLQELAIANDELLRYPAAWPNFGPGDDLSGHEFNPFWVRRPDGRYADLGAHIGLEDPYNSRGLAFGDVDGNGSLDIVVANQWEDSVLLRNQHAGSPAADVSVVRPGRAGAEVSAIGAQIELHHPDRPQRAQLFPANGHAGVSAAAVHLALPGGATTRATVTWRDSSGLHRADIDIRPGHQTVALGENGTAVVR